MTPIQQLKLFFRTRLKVVPGGPPVGTPGSNRAAGVLDALDALANFVEGATLPAVPPSLYGHSLVLHADTSGVLSWVDASQPVAPPTDFKLGFLGDSIYTNDYGTPGTPDLVTAHYASNSHYKGSLGNRAVSGNTIRDQIVAYDANPFAYDATVDSFVILEALVNTLGQGALTAKGDNEILAGAKADLLELHQKVRATGARVKTIACTAIAAGILAGQTRPDSVRQKQFRLIQKMNTWLRANYRTVLGAECLIDRMSDQHFDQLADTNDTSYYQDHVHPTQLARNTTEGPLAIAGVDAARLGQPVILLGDRDTSVNLDYVAPAILLFEAEDAGFWADSGGTWNPSSSSAWTGGGVGMFTNNTGTMRTTVQTVSRLKLITIQASGTGSFRLRLVRTRDNQQVYNQVASQATPPYASASDDNVALLDTGTLPLDEYRIELIAEQGPVSYDYLKGYTT